MAVGFAGGEYDKEVEEQRADGALVLTARGEGDGGLAGGFGPVATGEIGDGEQWFPDIRGAIVDGRKIGLGGSDGGGVVLNEADALTAELFGIEFAESFALFLRGLALHADDNAAIGEGVGQATDGSDH